jgi:dipeptidyl aminopeptidase/acylaminoacyl peptidase
MLVFHGRNDSLVPVEVARRFVDRLRQRSRAPVGYVELPRTQHAFDVLASIRCRHTTVGAVRFLEAIRQRVGERGAD